MNRIREILLIMLSISLSCSCEEEIDEEKSQEIHQEVNQEIGQYNAKTTSYFDYDKFITDGLVAYYPFNGGLNNLSGSGLDGIANNVSYSSDRFDNPERACHFNGIDSYIKIDNSEMLNGDKYTICFWFSDDLTDTLQQSIISKSDTARYGYTIGISKSYYTSNLNYAIKYEIGVELIGRLGLSKWIGRGERKYEFAAFAFSETGFIDYFRGSEANYSALTFKSNKCDLFIGKSDNGRFRNFKGELDDLLIYNRILTDDEIKDLSEWK